MANGQEQYERFVKNITSINKHIDKIAKIVENMAKIGIANNENEDFIVVMRNHKQLIEELGRIIEEYKKYLESTEL